MPEEIATIVLPVTETVSGPSVENATTSADIVEVTVLEPATTLAVLAPEMIDTEPEEIDAIVGLLDKITVGLDDSVTVPDDTATVLLVRVTWIADEGMTVKFDDGVTVRLLDTITVGFDDSVTAPEEMVTTLLVNVT